VVYIFVELHTMKVFPGESTTKKAGRKGPLVKIIIC